jgi:hypothetical protein
VQEAHVPHVKITCVRATASEPVHSSPRSKHLTDRALAM